MINPVSGPVALPQGSSSSSPNDPNPSDVQQFQQLVSGVAPLGTEGDSRIRYPHGVDPGQFGAQFESKLVNGIVVKIFNQQNKVILNGFSRDDNLE